MPISNPIGARVTDPPWVQPAWVQGAPSGGSLSMGARGPMHVQTLAFVAGNSPSPMQRLGMAPMFALGMLPPDRNESELDFGQRFPAQEGGGIWEPVLTANGGSVAQLKTSAR